MVQPGTMVHSYNSSVQEAETEQWQVGGHFGLHREPLFQTQIYKQQIQHKNKTQNPCMVRQCQTEGLP